MKNKLALGDKFVDCDDEELEVIQINGDSAVLRNEDGEEFVADMDEILQDIASGDLEYSDE